LKVDCYIKAGRVTACVLDKPVPAYN